VKVLIQRLEFGRVPAVANAEAEAAAREHGHGRRLLGDKGCLALRQDEDASDELDRLREAGQVPEQDEGLVEVGAPIVRPLPAGPVFARLDAEHVVVDE